jgi:hypothetical protein
MAKRISMARIGDEIARRITVGELLAMQSACAGTDKLARRDIVRDWAHDLMAEVQEEVELALVRFSLSDFQPPA